MRLLFEQTDRGYSWSNPHRYYLCDSDKEYDSIVSKWKDHKNDSEYIMWGRVYSVPSSTQAFVNTKIYAHSQTECSDGFCTHGGRNFEAFGVTIKFVSQTSSNDYSSYNHYIKPNSIVKNETAKIESWWA